MVTIPDKLKKQLEELIKDKLVTNYTNSSKCYISVYGSNQITEHTKSIVKTIRPATINDMFDNRDYKTIEEQKHLELIFNLEKEVDELNKLRNSIDNIQSFIYNNKTKENK